MEKGPSNAKQLFDKLEKMYIKEKIPEYYKNIYGHDLKIYYEILNIIFVFIGVRPACLVESEEGPIPTILLSFSNFDKNLIILKQEKNFLNLHGKKAIDFLFVNPEVIKEKGLEKEYKMLLNEQMEVVSFGKLLDYSCPNNIFENYDIYSKPGKDFRRRYIIEFIICEKINNQIILEPKEKLIFYICYDNKQKDYYYKDGLKRLKLYQEVVEQLIDKLHVGF